MKGGIKYIKWEMFLKKNPNKYVWHTIQNYTCEIYIEEKAGRKNTNSNSRSRIAIFQICLVAL